MTSKEKAEELIKLAITMRNSTRGLTIDDIQKQLDGCSRRSAERARAIIESLFHMDEVSSIERKKRWRLNKCDIDSLVNFTESDLASLELLKDLLPDYKKKKLVALIEKIKLIYSKKTHVADIDVLLESQGFAVKQEPRENIINEALEKIHYALLSQKKLEITYTDSVKNKSEMIIHPYGILLSDKQYLVAYNEKYGEIRLSKISRINEIKILDEYFEKDESFDLKKYSEQSFGVFQGDILDVCLEFNEKAKEDILNYHFHPTQEIKELEDNKVEVKFQASGSYEIITELLKWRDSVKILAPEKLKQDYKEEVEKMYKNIKGEI